MNPIKIDIAGQKFGRLLALKPTGISRRGSAIWLFKCDCGTEHTASGSAAKSGSVKSCGCLRKENHLAAVTLPEKLGALNVAYKNYRQSAHRRGLNFELSKEEFDAVMKQVCLYCGTEPRNMYGSYLGVGIDRKDSSKGYVVSNCIPCCTLCNKMKSALGADIFISQVTKICKHFYQDAEINLAYSPAEG